VDVVVVGAVTVIVVEGVGVGVVAVVVVGATNRKEARSGRTARVKVATPKSAPRSDRSGRRATDPSFSRLSARLPY
jgi:hypothetical protein